MLGKYAGAFSNWPLQIVEELREFLRQREFFELSFEAMMVTSSFNALACFLRKAHGSRRVAVTSCSLL